MNYIASKAPEQKHVKEEDPVLACRSNSPRKEDRADLDGACDESVSGWAWAQLWDDRLVPVVYIFYPVAVRSFSALE
eukprot:1162026-Pelagomonas_calceolata.AAC.3